MNKPEEAMAADAPGVVQRLMTTARENCLLVALFAALGVLAWQAAYIEFKFGGNWTALYLSGDRFPVPPSLAADGVYQFPGSFGYDGQFYHYIAHDPLLLKDTAEYVDNPRLRWRRILVPGLAHILALGQPGWIDTAYMAVALTSIFLGVFWLAGFARLNGCPAYFGLAFLAVPAVLVTIERMTVDCALAALAVGFVRYAGEGSRPGYYAILTLAPLVRETGIGFTIAAAAFSLHGRQWRRAGAEMATAFPFALWAIFVQRKTPYEASDWGSALPFSGLFTRTILPVDWEGPKAAVNAATLDAVALAGVWITLLLAAMVFRRRPLTLLHVAIGVFAGFTMFLGEPKVWAESIAFGRVLSPLIVWLLMFGIAHQLWAMALPLAVMTTRVAYEFAHRTAEILMLLRAQP